GGRRPWGRILGFFALALIISQPVAAQLLDKRISPLNPIDKQYMEAQRELVNEMTLRLYGGRCCRTMTELDYLQRLIDDGHVGPEQTRELQAMGVVMGDLLATELDLQWVIYEDIQGRSRA
ncbi:unnamed protein product, partial [Ectocarpus sp. 12 AP-2014]